MLLHRNLLTCYWLSFNQVWHGLFGEFCNGIRNKEQDDDCFYNTTEGCHNCALQLRVKPLSVVQTRSLWMYIQHSTTTYHIYGCSPSTFNFLLGTGCFCESDIYQIYRTGLKITCKILICPNPAYSAMWICCYHCLQSLCVSSYFHKLNRR